MHICKYPCKSTSNCFFFSKENILPRAIVFYCACGHTFYESWDVQLLNYDINETYVFSVINPYAHEIFLYEVKYISIV